MFQKNYKYPLNKFLFIISIFLLISSVNGYYADYLKVNAQDQTLTETFNIDKVDNYTYKLSYVRYGNIQEGMYVKLYVNGNIVKEYSKDFSNLEFGESDELDIDITNYLQNGSNELKIESNIWKTENSSPYYVIKNFKISEPNTTVKLPISLNLNFLAVILCLIFVIVRK